MDYENVPTAVFSNPPLGTVGLTESQALERFGVLDIYKADFRPMKNILPQSDARTFMKLVVDAASERVVGVHLLGPEAPELIQALAIAVKMGARKKDFDAVVAVHPTSAEEIVLLRTKERVERAKAAQ
jgi:glutathione reductase (NADPH)